MPGESDGYIARSRERLSGYAPRRIERPTAMPAAVLLPLIHHGGADRVILTVRSYDVEHHKGQISFPGGAVHAADADLATTALRETWEEIGVSPDDVEIIGQLDDIVTISNFVVAPFVGVIRNGPYEFVPSPVEVAEVIEPPVAHLLDAANMVWEERTGVDTVVRSPAYWFGGHRIWGATARMLYGFLQLLQAEVAR
ncbi:MAG TPA: CoA pyrophosphatase [Dehalococcoidia bacterium]